MHSEDALDLGDDELGVPALGVPTLDERMGVACLFADRGDDRGAWVFYLCQSSLVNVKWKGYFTYGLVGLARRVWLFPPSPLSIEFQKQKTEGAKLRGPQDRWLAKDYRTQKQFCACFSTNEEKEHKKIDVSTLEVVVVRALLL